MFFLGGGGGGGGIYISTHKNSHWLSIDVHDIYTYLKEATNTELYIHMMYYCSYIPTSFHMQQMHVLVNNKLAVTRICYMWKLVGI